jgi:hypothetical protein
MKYCSHTSDIPTEDHYAIVCFVSITTPGDERSRTNPGHGYPEHTDNYATYIAFADHEEWEKEINQRLTSTYGNKDFVAMKVSRAIIETSHTVKIS